MARRVPTSPSSSDQPPTRNWPEALVGAKYLGLLEKEVQGLRDRNPHGNRDLFLDDVFVLSLLAFHNPTLRSLRILEDISQSTQAQRQLTVDRIPRSTLSDFHKLADPERLQPIVEALRQRIPESPSINIATNEKPGPNWAKPVAHDRQKSLLPESRRYSAGTSTIALITPVSGCSHFGNSSIISEKPA
jgi:hypothetical protein